jgi:hypothetical protein
MTSSAVDRLVDAINAQDIEKFMACFAPSFDTVWPAHPARSFTGTDRVRSNWEGIFAAYPGVRATVLTRVQHGDEIWGEWEFQGDSKDDGPAFWQRGVIIAKVAGDAIVQTRFYMEPVESDPE